MKVSLGKFSVTCATRLDDTEALVVEDIKLKRRPSAFSHTWSMTESKKHDTIHHFLAL